MRLCASRHEWVLGFCGLILSILLRRADRREGGHLERAR
jgi:hypothetical protein